ncbi:hypothetical protein V1509DRAFT_632001 [Lipomyces kononenkoae]
MTSSECHDMARHLAPLISASPRIFARPPPPSPPPSSSSSSSSPSSSTTSPALTTAATTTSTATVIPLEHNYSFDENLQTRTFHPPTICSSPVRELSWLPMMPDVEPPTSPASVSESLIDPLCSALQAPQTPPATGQSEPGPAAAATATAGPVPVLPAPPAAATTSETAGPAGTTDEPFLNALYFPESGTFIGYRGFPTFKQTTQLVNAYISTLSSVKKNKSLISRQMYADIKTILRDAGNTQVGSAQFRFWARRNFELFRDDNGRVCVMHKGKPVAVREELYDVLAVCHLVCRHGGRDKTLGQLREWHSRVPKNLISQFIKLCPTCNPTSVTAQSHPEYVIDTQTVPSSSCAAGHGPNGSSDHAKSQPPVSFTLRKSIVCCKMNPGIETVVKAAESAATTADKGRDQSCYVVSDNDDNDDDDDDDYGDDDDDHHNRDPDATGAGPTATACGLKKHRVKSVRPVAFVDRDEPVRKQNSHDKNEDEDDNDDDNDDDKLEYSSFPPYSERVFLASGGTESTVSLHSDPPSEDMAITRATARKAIANFSALTQPSTLDVAPPPLSSAEVYYVHMTTTTTTTMSRTTLTSSRPGSPVEMQQPQPRRALLVEIEPNRVSQKDLPSSPSRPESDEDEYMPVPSIKRNPSYATSSSYSQGRRVIKRRRDTPMTCPTTTTAAAGTAATMVAAATVQRDSSPVRKSARLHKPLLF